MTSHTTDQALVDGLRAGRRDAFERLYHEYHPAIYNLCARVLGDREEAKDVTQDVFIKAFDRLPAPGAEDLRLRPWLYRVATNACFNHLRSRKGLSGGDGAVLDEMPARVDTFEQAETVALVEASLGQLSDRYRTALVLKDLHGLPPAEIASVMEVSRPTADVLVHRARGAFKVAFAKLAGDGATAPAALGLVLMPLSVPAALLAMPSLPASLASTAHLPSALAHHGLLAKLSTIAGSKVAIGAAAVTLIVAGGAAELATRAHNHNVADAATRSAQPRSTVKSTFASQPLGYWHNRYGCGTWSDQRGWRQMKSWSWHMNKGYTWSGGSWKAPRSSGSWSGSGGSSGGSWSSGSSGTWSGGSSSSSGSGSWSGGGSSSMGGSSWGGSSGSGW